MLCLLAQNSAIHESSPNLLNLSGFHRVIASRESFAVLSDWFQRVNFKGNKERLSWADGQDIGFVMLGFTTGTRDDNWFTNMFFFHYLPVDLQESDANYASRCLLFPGTAKTVPCPIFLKKS